MVESRIRPSWQPALARMCFVLLLCLLMPDRLFAGNCTQLAAETMTRAGVSATIKGFYVLVQPLDQTGSALPNVYIELNLTTLSEREKVYDWINGSIIEQADGGVQCNDPQQPIFGGDLALLDSCALTGACYVDALQNLGPTFDCGNEQPCGSLLQAIFTADLNCWQEHLYDQPYYSIHLEEVVVHFSDPKSNFSGTVAYVIPDNDYAYSYPPLTFNYMYVFFVFFVLCQLLCHFLRHFLTFLLSSTSLRIVKTPSRFNMTSITGPGSVQATTSLEEKRTTRLMFHCGSTPHVRALNQRQAQIPYRTC